MRYIQKNSPLVCSTLIELETDENMVIKKVRFTGGCHGNLQGIAALTAGMEAGEALRRLRGIRCGGKATSCPDQLAEMLENILSGRLQPAD